MTLSYRVMLYQKRLEQIGNKVRSNMLYFSCQAFESIIYALLLHVLQRKRDPRWRKQLASRWKSLLHKFLRHMLETLHVDKAVRWMDGDSDDQTFINAKYQTLVARLISEVHAACYWCTAQKAFQQINIHFISSFPDPTILLLNCTKLIFHQTCLKDEWIYMSQFCMGADQMGKPICYPH